MGFRTSEHTDKLAAALAKAQGEFKPALETSENGAFGNSKYANLQQCWAACQGALNKNGLAISFGIGPVIVLDEKYLYQEVTTRLMCGDQWMECTGGTFITKATAHGQGSAVTYGKRYGLCAIISLVTAGEFDDDGNAASDVEAPIKTAKTSKYTPKPKTMADMDNKKWVGKKGGKCYLHRNNEDVNIETLDVNELKELLSEDWAKPIHKEIQNLLDSTVFDDMQEIEAAMDKMMADERK